MLDGVLPPSLSLSRVLLIRVYVKTDDRFILHELSHDFLRATVKK